MKVTYTRTALKALRKIPAHKAKDILAGMEKVAADPFLKDNTVKTMQGVKNGFRKRFGDWRVLYTVDTDIKILEVFDIGTRGEIYK
jgi:mRNA interferase RelE/StbE